MTRYGVAEMGPGKCRFLWIETVEPEEMAERNKLLCAAHSDLRWWKVAYEHLQESQPC